MKLKLLTIFVCLFSQQINIMHFQYISPKIMSRGQIGNQVPNGFGPKSPIINPSSMYISPMANCPCAVNMPNQCPSCNSEQSMIMYKQMISVLNCACAPKLNCPPCPVLYSNLHEKALKQVKFNFSYFIFIFFFVCFK